MGNTLGLGASKQESSNKNIVNNNAPNSYSSN